MSAKPTQADVERARKWVRGNMGPRAHESIAQSLVTEFAVVRAEVRTALAAAEQEREDLASALENEKASFRDTERMLRITEQERDAASCDAAQLRLERDAAREEVATAWKKLKRAEAQVAGMRAALPPSATLRGWARDAQQREGKWTGVMRVMVERAIAIEEIQRDTAAAAAAHDAEIRRRALEEAACCAERVVDGYTANIRIDESEQEFIKDPDGPWVLNSNVAKAIRALLEPAPEEKP